MYFNSPPASRNRAPASGPRNSNPAPQAMRQTAGFGNELAPKSNGSSHPPPKADEGVVASHDDEDCDDEDEDDFMDDVAAYQQQLRSQGAPGAGMQVEDEDDEAEAVEETLEKEVTASVALALAHMPLSVGLAEPHRGEA